MRHQALILIFVILLSAYVMQGTSKTQSEADASLVAHTRALQDATIAQVVPSSPSPSSSEDVPAVSNPPSPAADVEELVGGGITLDVTPSPILDVVMEQPVINNAVEPVGMSGGDETATIAACANVKANVVLVKSLTDGRVF